MNHIEIKIMAILKKDIPIVKEFLGTTDNLSSYVSPFKCVRMYRRKDAIIENSDYKGIVFILTPMMRGKTSTFDFWLGMCSGRGLKLKYTEHQRGNNYVYTFEKTE